MFNKLSHLQQRLISGSVAAILAISFMLLSQVPAFKPIAIGVIIAAIAASMWELNQISYSKNLQPAAALGISAGVVYALAVALSTQYTMFALLPEIVLLGSLISFFIYFFIKGESPFLNLSITIFSFVYLAIPLSCMIAITYFFTLGGTQDGSWWILYLIVTTKLTDTAAFTIGRRYGANKLAPYISPNKTWEGALGGLCMALICSLSFMFISKITGAAFNLSFWQSIWLGGAIGILAQFGDLAESLLKRDGGVKDSNHLPGLGGVLDTVDSLVFTAPLVYIFLKAYS